MEEVKGERSEVRGREERGERFVLGGRSGAGGRNSEGSGCGGARRATWCGGVVGWEESGGRRQVLVLMRNMWVYLLCLFFRYGLFLLCLGIGHVFVCRFALLTCFLVVIARVVQATGSSLLWATREVSVLVGQFKNLRCDLDRLKL